MSSLIVEFSRSAMYVYVFTCVCIHTYILRVYIVYVCLYIHINTHSLYRGRLDTVPYIALLGGFESTKTKLVSLLERHQTIEEFRHLFRSQEV